MKYRKKPVIIEAFQMTTERMQDNSEWPAWLHEAWQKYRHQRGALYRIHERMLGICTLEGHMNVTPGTWIVRGIAGELYPIQADIFEQTYEPVEGPDEEQHV